MNKNENRAVIKYFWLKGYKPIEIFEEMHKALGEEMAPSWTTVKNWVADFKRGRVSVEDVKRSGRPKEVTTLENITKIEKLLEQNRQLKVADIAKAIGLSKERAFNILVKELGMRKLENGWERIKLSKEIDESNEQSNENELRALKAKKNDNEEELLRSTALKNNANKNKRKIIAKKDAESALSMKRKCS